MTVRGSHLRGTALVLAVLSSSVLAGCTATAEVFVETDAQPMPVAVSHVHGVDVDDARERAVIAMHHGFLSVDISSAADPTSAPRVLGDYRGDVMSFVRAGDRFLLSGHPPAGSSEPANVGVLMSDLEARDWRPLALSGDVDFHAMSHLSIGVDTLTAGIDSASGRVMTSDDGGASWRNGAAIAARDLAIDPLGATLIVTTADGPFVSDDLGQTWRAVDEAPLLVLIESGFNADGERWLFGVDLNGALHASPDGHVWHSLGILPFQPEAFGVGERGTMVIANTQVVMKSSDLGQTWSPIADLRLPAVSASY